MTSLQLATANHELQKMLVSKLNRHYKTLKTVYDRKVCIDSLDVATATLKDMEMEIIYQTGKVV